MRSERDSTIEFFQRIAPAPEKRREARPVREATRRVVSRSITVSPRRRCERSRATRAVVTIDSSRKSISGTISSANVPAAPRTRRSSASSVRKGESAATKSAQAAAGKSSTRANGSRDTSATTEAGPPRSLTA